MSKKEHESDFMQRFWRRNKQERLTGYQVEQQAVKTMIASAVNEESKSRFLSFADGGVPLPVVTESSGIDIDSYLKENTGKLDHKAIEKWALDNYQDLIATNPEDGAESKVITNHDSGRQIVVTKYSLRHTFRDAAARIRNAKVAKKKNPMIIGTALKPLLEDAVFIGSEKPKEGSAYEHIQRVDKYAVILQKDEKAYLEVITIAVLKEGRSIAGLEADWLKHINSMQLEALNETIRRDKRPQPQLQTQRPRDVRMSRTNDLTEILAATSQKSNYDIAESIEIELTEIKTMSKDLQTESLDNPSEAFKRFKALRAKQKAGVQAPVAQPSEDDLRLKESSKVDFYINELSKHLKELEAKAGKSSAGLVNRDSEYFPAIRKLVDEMNRAKEVNKQWSSYFKGWSKRRRELNGMGDPIGGQLKLLASVFGEAEAQQIKADTEQKARDFVAGLEVPQAQSEPETPSADELEYKEGDYYSTKLGSSDKIIGIVTAEGVERTWLRVNKENGLNLPPKVGLMMKAIDLLDHLSNHSKSNPLDGDRIVHTARPDKWHDLAKKYENEIDLLVSRGLATKTETLEDKVSGLVTTEIEISPKVRKAWESTIAFVEKLKRKAVKEGIAKPESKPSQYFAKPADMLNRIDSLRNEYTSATQRQRNSQELLTKMRRFTTQVANWGYQLNDYELEDKFKSLLNQGKDREAFSLATQAYMRTVKEKTAKPVQKYDIGFSWGDKEVKEFGFDYQAGEWRYAVSNNKTGVIDFISESGIAEAMELDAREEERQKRLEEENKQADIEEAKRQAKYEDTQGFADNLPPVQKGKVLSFLNKVGSFRGQAFALKDLISHLLDNNWTLVNDDGDTYLAEPNSDTVVDLKKTSYDFAKYLAEKKGLAIQENETPTFDYAGQQLPITDNPATQWRSMTKNQRRHWLENRYSKAHARLADSDYEDLPSKTKESVAELVQQAQDGKPLELKIKDAQAAGIELTENDIDELYQLAMEAETLNVKANALSNGARHSELDDIARHFHLGRVGGSGRNNRKLNAKREAELDKTIKSAKDALEIWRRADAKTAQINKMLKGEGTEAWRNDAPVREWAKTMKDAASLVGEILNWIQSPAMLKETRRWASPKFLQHVDKAFKMDAAKTVDTLKKMDSTVRDHGGLVKILGVRSNAGKFVKQALEDQLQLENLSAEAQASAFERLLQELTEIAATGEYDGLEEFETQRAAVAPDESVYQSDLAKHRRAWWFYKLQAGDLADDGQGNQVMIETKNHYSIIAAPFADKYTVTELTGFTIAEYDALIAEILDSSLMQARLDSQLMLEAITYKTPTQKQLEAGNYKKLHKKLFGFDVAIETQAGETRSGVDPDGVEWESKMPVDYGYLKGTLGNDGDHIDAFFGKNERSEKVFIVNQTEKTGYKFDEHKVLLGFDNAKQAKDAYLGAYEAGWNHYSNIVETDLTELKDWLKNGSQKKEFKRAG